MHLIERSYRALMERCHAERVDNRGSLDQSNVLIWWSCFIIAIDDCSMNRDSMQNVCQAKQQEVTLGCDIQQRRYERYEIYQCFHIVVLIPKTYAGFFRSHVLLNPRLSFMKLHDDVKVGLIIPIRNDEHTDETIAYDPIDIPGRVSIRRMLKSTERGQLFACHSRIFRQIEKLS
jgi:hypothetical protein